MQKEIYIIYWRDISGIDSADNSSSWFTKKQAIKEAQKLYDEEFTTIGEIIAETENFVVVAATCDNDLEEAIYSDMSMIPKSVIIRKEKIIKAEY